MQQNNYESPIAKNEKSSSELDGAWHSFFISAKIHSFRSEAASHRLLLVQNIMKKLKMLEMKVLQWKVIHHTVCLFLNKCTVNTFFVVLLQLSSL